VSRGLLDASSLPSTTLAYLNRLEILEQNVDSLTSVLLDLVQRIYTLPNADSFTRSLMIPGPRASARMDKK
jgi:hypothetical protein